jgi:MFS family permease
MMIVTRALQGFLGGAMIPTVFAIAFIAFPAEKRIMASTIIGMVVTMAPTIGPSLGGWITENLDWRWLFFVNVAPGIAVMGPHDRLAARRELRIGPGVVQRLGAARGECAERFRSRRNRFIDIDIADDRDEGR